jgi:hypothetical protein
VCAYKRNREKVCESDVHVNEPTNGNVD